ncbi:hypothetical protein [Candidatus Palauibacter soopunensis]|uniref:hypothetical protein n=1 Tax=Candidatus Palauibacter soopunensis TaxID=3056739 RepID=UPI0023850425|nr:hypothetical protein [Candidatus Palauibacter soopunensis]MDE2880143.1 hypothetical protein [Candidatus Palauibacter soopunensis]
MPNGGPDCCGTCWFNRANGGRKGHGHHDRSIASHCEIRDLTIRDPFYTYCYNHPFRLDRREPIPLGPVFVAEGPWSERKVWVESPDTEEIRSRLLELLADPSAAGDHYPLPGPPTTGVVVIQLAEFRERRAIPILERIERDLAGRPEEARFIREAIERIRGSLGEDGAGEA